MRKISTWIICMMLMISFIGFFPIKTSIADPSNAAPVLSNAYPSDVTATYNPRLSITVNDIDYDPLTVIFKTNATVNETWQVIGIYNDGNKEYTQNTTTMMAKNKTYYWSINVSDGTTWVNNTYDFIAQPFVFKWSKDTNAYTGISPLAVDVNGDRIYEVFHIGNNKITCFNGSNGNINWEYSHPSILNHSAFEIADLNNDSIPEIVISGDITYDGTGKTIALHADSGDEYWVVEAESAQKYLCIADIDGNGYPYVYVCSGNPYEGTTGSGRLRKLRGTDGATLKDIFVWRPCWGGPSIADADNDGKFELYLCDRRANYSTTDYKGQLGLGMQCYDAETLDLLWYQDALTCSSHMLMLADVNSDGILDAVACNQAYNSGIYTVDGATWDKMTGYWEHSIESVYGSHSPPALGDCDGDGRLELIFCKYGPTIVWDMGLWEIDAILDDTAEPPCIADVYGDNRPEIIAGSYNASPIKIYDGSSYALLETISPGGIARFCIQDIDNDGQNELITINSGGIIRVYDTSAYTPISRPRTNNQCFSERRTNTNIYTPIPGAPQPIIKNVSPQNNTHDVQLNPTLCAHVIDFHYDRMDITIDQYENGSWINLATYSNARNGWFNITTSTMNQQNTTYIWRVTAFDPDGDRLWTNKTYRFTTLAPPIISNIVATPSEILPGNSVNISCTVTDGTSINTVKVNITSPNGQKTNITAIGGNPVWSVLKYDDFESGWGSYTDGGTKCLLYTGTTYAYQGTRAIKIQNYLGLDSSFYLTQAIDVDTPRYTTIKVDFWFKTHGMSNLTNFWVKYYDGQHWRIVDNYIKPGPIGHRPSDKPFDNDVFYHGITFINKTKYNFPKDMKIRFECDALNDFNSVYIDKIYINATTEQGSNYYLNQTYMQSGTYQYFIWADDNSGNSKTSVSKSFTITGWSNRPPTFSNPSPSNGSTGVTRFHATNVTVHDLDGNSTTVCFWYSVSNNPYSWIKAQQNNSVVANTTVRDLNSSYASGWNTQYWWRVTAFDGYVNSSVIYTFTTKNIESSSGGGSYTPPENIKPIADTSAGAPYKGFVNETILFDGSNSYDPDGNITKWLWFFGDNTNGTGKTVNHTFLKQGTYLVTLTVIDNEGATNTNTTNCVVTQQNQPPSVPSITGPTNGTKNTMYTYAAISSDADNDTLQYTFNWGDLLSESSEFLPSGISVLMNHSWAVAGRYDISVTVSDNQTESSSKITVYVDAIQTGAIGYLIDNDSDGIYDVFYSEELQHILPLQKKNDWYLIDSDGDGDFDYSYNKINGLISYQEITKTTDSIPILFIIFIIVTAVIIITFIWKKKSK